RRSENQRMGFRGRVAEALLRADVETERPHVRARTARAGRKPVKRTVESEHLVETDIDVVPSREVVCEGGNEIQPRRIGQEGRIVLVVGSLDVLRPCGSADVVNRPAGSVGKSLGFSAGVGGDPDWQIEELTRPAEANERTALECLAAAGTEKLRIGV